MPVKGNGLLTDGHQTGPQRNQVQNSDMEHKVWDLTTEVGEGRGEEAGLDPEAATSLFASELTGLVEGSPFRMSCCPVLYRSLRTNVRV